MAIRYATEHKSFVKPEEIREFPSGRDAWLIGAEPLVVVDFYGASTCARG